MKIQQFIQQAATTFENSQLCYGHGTDNAWDEAVYLTCGALDIPFDAQSTLATELNSAQLLRLNALVNQRVTEKTPVAYLVGKAWFGGHQFVCDQRALVPRSPLAELIANRFEPMLKTTPDKILDLCCGGGCIGIACAHMFHEAHVDLVDISPPALGLAEENVALHELSSRVAVLKSDLFSEVDDQYELIVCNPPYVGKDEFSQLPQEYCHEPKSGLFSADQGLAIPLEILSHAADYLSDDGLLVMEVGNSASALMERLATVPLLWLDFENGGAGVFCCNRAQLRQCRECFT